MTKSVHRSRGGILGQGLHFHNEKSWSNIFNDNVLTLPSPSRGKDLQFCYWVGVLCTWLYNSVWMSLYSRDAIILEFLNLSFQMLIFNVTLPQELECWNHFKKKWKGHLLISTLFTKLSLLTGKVFLRFMVYWLLSALKKQTYFPQLWNVQKIWYVYVNPMKHRGVLKISCRIFRSNEAIFSKNCWVVSFIWVDIAGTWL